LYNSGSCIPQEGGKNAGDRYLHWGGEKKKSSEAVSSWWSLLQTLAEVMHGGEKKAHYKDQEKRQKGEKARSDTFPGCTST